jgi:NAD(P)-dependent dehydrogenase (short-subunit alcohol dehydrogenase family)
MNPRYDFTGKIALVTGAASGMGLAAARAFAESGAAVALVDRDAAQAQAVADELIASGRRAIAIGCDVSDEPQVAAAVDRTVRELGGLDIAFNNAGVQARYAGSADETLEDYERIISINQRGIWASMKHELRHMRDQGSGTIVNSSSIGGLFGGPGRAAYHASKHAVIGLTKSAAKEFGPLGIRINAVCPGTIDTPMVKVMVAAGNLDHDAAVAAIPLRRLGTPEEIAAAVLWLSSPGAGFVTGIALLADGGQLA